MVPLGWALRAAGHEVRVATRSALVDAAADTGLTVVAVGEETSGEAPGSADAARTATGVRDLLPDPGEIADLSWESLLSVQRTLADERLRAVNEPILDDLVLLCRQWLPHLVLWEPTTVAGAVAAEACGAAHARFLWSPDLHGALREHFLSRRAEPEADRSEDPLREWLAPHAERHGVGFGEELTRGRFSLTPLATVLDGTQDGPERLRHIHYGGQTTIPTWLRDRPGETPAPDAPRRVLLDWRAAGAAGGDPDDKALRRVLDGLGTLENTEIVLVLPEGEDEDAEMPSGVTRAVGQGALHALAPTCSLAVHAGGIDTFCEVGRHGVPQLVLPDPGLPDAVASAERLAALGAGSVLPHGEAESDSVAEEAVRLLADPETARAAERLREALDAAPTPDRLVERIERLTAEHSRFEPSEL
ncbi:nucleotide disphospho-sugar-binding domain-containing protein [Nocardiopsis sp. LDBS1602]|uniref:nucleotide disphospho-sugar-binding domain-containing protein n=1 Tax=Nocardiopsis sp. LDBS1602 TaxID=3109597 RepID=UPI002DBBB7C0|nr:nucleotide disphospho-sugar-binding domain-containing protein [Nocardiopsis sp. LDBS1602]MEC3892624.1 nucleotide disphospho-sugar-binding domain-containing protein [Nocardiopsis sp. LDBS1602]